MDKIKPFLQPEMKRIRWSREQADRACGHLVYVFWKEGRPLYIGKSSMGLTRPLDPAHAWAVIARNEAESIEFICCKDGREADLLERQLIYNLQPQYNRVGKVAQKQRKPQAQQPAKAGDPWPEPIRQVAKPWS